MGLHLEDLNSDGTRACMLGEMEHDIAAGVLYYGKYLSPAGREQYPTFLRTALESGTDDSLASALQAPGIFLDQYEKNTPSGGRTMANVPYTAPNTLAEGEFNRFYLRGICQRIILSASGKVEIYRARPSANPRSESEAMIGHRFDASDLLADLRANVGVDTALGLPPGPNSGLSGKIVS